MSSWVAESLRLSAFPTAPNTPQTAPSWWSAITGHESDATSSRPKIGLLQEDGFLGTSKLTLVVLPGRIDWHFSAAPINSQPSGIPPEGQVLPLRDFEVLGPLAAALQQFHTMMDRWLEELSPPLNRLAFGAVLLQPVDSLAGGYRVLGSYLKDSVKLDPDNSSDFIYSINRPRLSESLKNSRFNRLSKWSVAATRVVEISAALVASRQSVNTLGTAAYACRVELDLNTPAEFEGALPKDKLKAILQELITLGIEISEKGDV